MERYIIPFEYKSHNYYVFIGKHPGEQSFNITQLIPETGEKLERQIPVQTVRSFMEPISPMDLNLQQTIIRCLASYLQQKGWPIDETASS